MSWFTTALEIYGLVILVAKSITALTPTNKDDKILDAVVYYTELLGLDRLGNNKPEVRAKQTKEW